MQLKTNLECQNCLDSTGNASKRLLLNMTESYGFDTLFDMLNGSGMSLVDVLANLARLVKKSLV